MLNNIPVFQEVDSLTPLLMDTKVLKSIIAETSFAASTQESRPILTGVHFVLSNHKDLKAVATDSHRMSQRQLVLEHSADNFDVVIPSRSLKELSAVFSDDIENLEVFFSANQILFRSEQFLSIHVYLKEIIQTRIVSCLIHLKQKLFSRQLAFVLLWNVHI